jgi:transposase
MRGKKRYIKLTDKQRQELEAGFKNGKKATYRKRCHYILLSDQGYSMEAIAKMYNVTRQTVATWFDNYERLEIRGLHSQKGQGRPRILRIENKVESKAVEELVEAHAQNLRPILEKLEKRFGKSMSKRTLQRFLKKRITAGNASVEAPPDNPTP